MSGPGKRADHTDKGMRLLRRPCADFTLWALSEIFTHMDLARLCDLNVDKRLPAFNIESWDKPAQPPGELSRSVCSGSCLGRR